MLFGKNINHYYLKYLHYFILGIAALIAVDYFQLEIPVIIREIVDGLDTRTLDVDYLEQLMKKMLMIIGVMFVGRFLWRICIFGNGIRIQADLREKMFVKSEKLSQEYYSQNKTGALMALFTSDLQAIRMGFGRGTVLLIDFLFLGTMAFYRMFKINIYLTIASAVPLVIIAIASSIIGRFMRIKFRERQKSFADMNDFVQESFSGLSVIKAFVKEGKELAAFRWKNKDFKDKNIDFVRASTLLNILIGAFIASVNLIIILFGGYLVYSGKMLGGNSFTVGQLTEYIAYFGSLTWPMMAIGQLINLRSQGNASLSRVNDLLNYNIDIINSVDVITDHEIQGNISFRNLNFAFPGTDKLVLEDISFDIKVGESVGIIGRTGSGKTTVVDLLLRIYNLEPNQLFIDDIDIMNLDYTKVRDAIAYVPQDNFLFSDSIKNNIAFSEINTIDKDVVRAAKLADIHENISEFAYKYDTILGERGVTVSGGQKQRISIARALIKNSQILILDDSVSAVDTKTEEAILSNLKKIRSGKTTILIAHRISTIQDMDKIVLIDEGKVVAVGKHEELLEKSKLYNKMVLLQKLEDEVGGQL